MSEVEKTVIAAYMGRRLTTKNRLAFFWLFDGEEKPHGYDKQLAPAQIGERWKVTMRGESIVIAGTARPVQTHNFLHEQAAAWEVEHVAALHEYSEVRAAAKLEKRRSQFERALDPLRALLAAANYNRTERAHFINQVALELWKV